MGVQVVAWVGFLVLIGLFLALDLGVFHKGTETPSTKSALKWTLIWFIVALFFPWNLTDFVAISCCPYLAAAANAAFFLFKLFVVLFFSVTLVRISVARFRITQVVDVYWKILGALSLVGLILVMVDAHVR